MCGGTWPYRFALADILTIKRSEVKVLLMIHSNTDIIQGTLDLLILRTVDLAPLHGYGIARRIEDVSDGVFRVNPGSLLTALRRLEGSGWLQGEWHRTENGRRARYYRLTPDGERRLAQEKALWQTRSRAMGRLLGAEG